MQELCKNDVFAASFRLKTPGQAGTIPFGSLLLTCERLQPEVERHPFVRSENVPNNVPDAAKFKGARLPESREESGELAAGGDGCFQLRHKLPQVAICPVLASAELRLPASAAVGQPFDLAMQLEVCEGGGGDQQQVSVHASMGATGAVHLQQEALQIVHLKPGGSETVTWQAVGAHKGAVEVLATAELAADGLQGEGAQLQDAGGVSADAAAMELSGSMLLTNAA